MIHLIEQTVGKTLIFQVIEAGGWECTIIMGRKK